jgi:hypothetical protein
MHGCTHTIILNTYNGNIFTSFHRVRHKNRHTHHHHLTIRIHAKECIYATKIVFAVSRYRGIGDRRQHTVCVPTVAWFGARMNACACTCAMPQDKYKCTCHMSFACAHKRRSSAQATHHLCSMVQATHHLCSMVQATYFSRD